MFSLLKRLASAISAPAAGRTSIVADTDNAIKRKTDDGVTATLPAFRGLATPNTPYAFGDLAAYNGVLQEKKNQGQSSAIFDPTQWNSYNQRQTPATLVLLGDSLTALHTFISGGAGTQVNPAVTEPILNARGFFNVANVLLGSPFTLVNYAGVGGENTAQVLARLQTDVIAFNPGYCLVLAGTNDQFTGGLTTAQSQANLTAIWSGLVAAGIKPIACTLSARKTLTTTQQTWYSTMNRWIRATAAASNYLLCDLENSIIDRTNGGVSPAAATVDDVHFSLLGASMVAFDVQRTLAGKLPALALPVSNVDKTCLNTNPLLLGTAGAVSNGATGTWATGYVLSSATLASVVASKVARAGGFEWQQIVVGDNGTVRNIATYATLPVAGLTTGQVLEFIAEFEVDAAVTNWNGIYLEIVAQTAGGSALKTVTTLAYGSSDITVARPLVLPSGIITVPRFVVPDTSTFANVYARLRFECQSATVRIGRFVVRTVA